MQLFAALPGVDIVTATVDGFAVKYVNDVHRVKEHLKVGLEALTNVDCVHVEFIAPVCVVRCVCRRYRLTHTQVGSC